MNPFAEGACIMGALGSITTLFFYMDSKINPTQPLQPMHKYVPLATIGFCVALFEISVLISEVSSSLARLPHCLPLSCGFSDYAVMMATLTALAAVAVKKAKTPPGAADEILST